MTEPMTHIYVAKIGKVTGRHGQECRLLKARRGKALIRFADGWECLTMLRCLRRLKGGESCGESTETEAGQL